MGGKAFAHLAHPLVTPRMSKEAYLAIKNRVVSSLNHGFSWVDLPIEGPEKQDYGDVDVIIAKFKGYFTTKEVLLDHVGLLLGAEHQINSKGPEVSANFAVPWPKDVPYPPGYEDGTTFEVKPPPATPGPSSDSPPKPSSPEAELTPEEEAAKNKAYFESRAWRKTQIRVAEPCREGEKKRFSWIDRSLAARIPRNSPNYAAAAKELKAADEEKKKAIRQAKYMRFFHSHGDIWQMLGSTIRPFGLTVDNVGLWIRIPEIESVNRNQAKIWLTSQPNIILKFLDVAVPQYWRPFLSIQEMFHYVAKCPMFSVPADENEDRAGMTSNDRSRMANRPVYRKWIEEFKPSCREQGIHTESLLTRETVKEKAFVEFKIESEYLERLRKFIHQEQKKTIRKAIKAADPIGDGIQDHQTLYRRGLTIKAMSEIIIDCVDESLYGIVAPRSLWHNNGLWNMDKVQHFITKNMDFVGVKALERDNKRGEREELETRIKEEARQKREKHDRDEREKTANMKRDVQAKIQLEAELYKSD
ncbi:hypothetical protein FHETE_1900 [Fusarium heterosporum]|uniref:Uncharacterized protein n=1 Tax=Fusarium heterosporum TaxID=42747 RepID=A0A8H5X0I3_FUSHE|nr:hypothetical protein FHETE_1900 [Fusarium heterosporum]